MKALRIVFMGTPEFAVEGLKTLVDAGEQVVGVITAPDRPAGRGRKMTESAVKSYARAQGLTILQPTNLKAEDFLDDLRALNANLQIVVAFRMLPKIVWQMPEYGTFNLHASLLPQYRGAAPINWAIINGEHKTGVSTFFIDENIDTGAIILQKEAEITDGDNASDLHDTLMQLGAQLILETVGLIREGRAAAEPQDKNKNSLIHAAPKLHRDNTKIDWEWPVKRIINFIRGLNPYPAAWSILENKGGQSRVKIYAAHPAGEDEKPSESLKIGTLTVKNGRVLIRTGQGFIILDEVQLPGKRKMKVKDLLNGFSFSEDAKMR